MKTRLPRAIAFAAASFIFPIPALAAEGADRSPALPDRAALCAQEAKGLKAQDRERYLEQCESRGAVATSDGKPMSQQERMKSCNAQARVKELHGDERRSFMSGCLKG